MSVRGRARYVGPDSRRTMNDDMLTTTRGHGPRPGLAPMTAAIVRRACATAFAVGAAASVAAPTAAQTITAQPLVEPRPPCATSLTDDDCGSLFVADATPSRDALFGTEQPQTPPKGNARE